MGCLEVECLKCGCQFTISADEVETKKEFFCPGCSLKIDDRLWRKMRIGFLTMEATMERLDEPVLELRLFQAKYQFLDADSASPLE